jgi:hypothetical protein
MPNSYEATFVARLSGMDDDSLLRTLIRVDLNPEAYRPEAIAAVRDEVARRHLTDVQRAQAETRLKQETSDALQEDAVRMALEDQPVSVIEEHLKARGVDEAIAAAVAKRASDVSPEERRNAARRKMISGAEISLAGVAISGVTYYLASTTPGGGLYVIAVGLIAAGLIRFFQGAADAAGQS